MEEVGRKLYLSETPSIGWEAKTLGAKRRISSSEIATVPGTLDLVESLFSAVLMLVDWLVASVSRSREARLWELPEFFRRSVSVEKYAGHIFRAESEALAERPAEEGLEGQEPRGTRRVDERGVSFPECAKNPSDHNELGGGGKHSTRLRVGPRGLGLFHLSA